LRAEPVAAWAAIEIIEGASTRTVEVPREGLRLGRASGNTVVLAATSVSGHHAELRWQGDDLRIEDLGSSYGTRRDGVLLDRPTLLADGDEVVLGGAVVLRVTVRGAGFGAPTSELLGTAAGLEARRLDSAVQPLELELLPVVESLLRAVSHEDLGDRIVRALGEHFHASRVALIELEHAGERFRVLGLHNASRVDTRPLRDVGFVSRTVVEAAVRDGVAHYREGGGKQVVKSLLMSGAHSAAAAAVRPSDGRLRVLYMDACATEPPLSAQHARTLELFAAHVRAAFDAVGSRIELAQDRVRFEHLRRYFSPAVVEHLLAGGGKIVDRPRVADATVLFADLVGYTAIAERYDRDPGRMLDLLNRWLDAGARCAMAHGGTLDKFIGDCVMVIFGVPFPQRDAELLAVRCSLKMTGAIARISAETGDQLNITVGINSGPMLAGSVGSRRRLEYTVLGDTVNVASRLQGHAHAGEILVGPETRRRLEGRVQFEDAGSFTPKNRAPLDCYRVIRVLDRGDESVPPPPSTGRDGQTVVPPKTGD
jgi:adenylate cyclase